MTKLTNMHHLALMIVSALLVPISQAAPLQLNQAANFTVLQYNSTGSGQTQFSISGGSTILNGNLGLADNTKANFSGNPPSGPLYRSSVNTSGGYNGLTPLTGSAVDTMLTQAVSDASNAAAAAAALSPTQTFANAITGGSITGSGGVNVINFLAGINMTNGDLTLSGTVDDVFIFNVYTKFVSSGGSSLLLSGGVTASNVLFNYLGASGAAFTGGGHSDYWAGTLLAPNAKISIHDRTFNGAFISSKDISITSNPVVNFVPFNPPPDSSVPEPTTYFLITAGLTWIGLRKFASEGK